MDSVCVNSGGLELWSLFFHCHIHCCMSTIQINVIVCASQDSIDGDGCVKEASCRHIVPVIFQKCQIHEVNVKPIHCTT